LRCGWKSIVVNDASTDGTREILDGLAETGFGGPGAPSRENRAKAPRSATGIAVATGDAVVVQDADLEYDPADLPALLLPIPVPSGRCGVWIAVSRRPPSRALLLALRRQPLLDAVVEHVSPTLNLTDLETCYKLVRTDLLKGLPLSSNRFGFEVEITARLAQARARIWEMPISYSGRTYAEGKKITWRDGFAALFHILRYNLLVPRNIQAWRLPAK